MKVLHLTYHFGCASDLNYVFKALGHEITYLETTHWPYTITEDIAHRIWSENKEEFQKYDLIVTSDTAALSFPFLLHAEEMKARLVIWICNRFNINMEGIPVFIKLFRESVHKEKISIVPYSAFEQEWCKRHGIGLVHGVINSLGRHVEKYICNDHIMRRIFRPLDTSCQTKPDGETFFVQDYHNNASILVPFLRSKGVSFAFGRYMDVSEIKRYKASISLPDAFCKIFYFEAIQHQIVVMLPSLTFMKHLFDRNAYGFTSKQYVSKDTMSMCEWYKYPECYVFFDSFEHLIHLIDHFNPQPVKDQLYKVREPIHDATLERWKLILST